MFIICINQCHNVAQPPWTYNGGAWKVVSWFLLLPLSHSLQVCFVYSCLVLSKDWFSCSWFDGSMQDKLFLTADLITADFSCRTNGLLYFVANHGVAQVAHMSPLYRISHSVVITWSSVPDVGTCLYRCMGFQIRLSARSAPFATDCCWFLLCAPAHAPHSWQCSGVQLLVHLLCAYSFVHAPEHAM